MPLDDLLAHLEPYRARMRDLLEPDPAFPAAFRSSLRPTVHATKGDLRREDVTELVEQERNPVFRALWILLAGGGIRVSEALNMWNVDVMPSHMSRFFGSADLTGTPLVLLAHPTRSVYLGNPGASSRSGPDREAALRQRYGLVARPLLPKKDGLYAGWKGLMPHTGYQGDAFVYWIDPEWAREFGNLVGQIRGIRQEAGSDLRHPYLFVNAVASESKGDPLRVGNVEQAFRRACDRVGLVVGQSIPTVHWLRHFYKVTAQRDLELGPHDLQIMMHHASAGSHEDYGKRAQDLHKSLSKIFGGPHAA